MNLDEAAWFFGPEFPGRLATEEGVIVYQPYEGVHIFGDQHKRVRDDGLIVGVEEKLFPKGVARTVPFTVGLGARMSKNTYAVHA